MPEAPILVFDADGSGLLSFDSPGAAAGYMEPPEVEEDAYRVFDSVGHEATVTISKWDVTITGWSWEPHESDFRRLLAVFLSLHGIRVDDRMSLKGVVDESLSLARQLERSRTLAGLVASIIRRFRDHM